MQTVRAYGFLTQITLFVQLSITSIDYPAKRRLPTRNNDYSRHFRKIKVNADLRRPNLELNGEIARILLNPQTKQILDITLYEEDLRFECRRCATFCCKLDGPKLTKKDIQRIEHAGYRRKEFLDSFKGRFKGSPTFLGNLKSTEDGSCIFLKFTPEKNNYECSIYNFRPALCKLYPFDSYKMNPQSIVLRLIPCCRGLNNPDGELVNERFVVSFLFDAIVDLHLRREENPEI
jgi:Fe-S-cluster containining protein